MTPDPARSHDPYPWLAGYVDGELDAATRRRVEAWVEADPAAAEELRTQDAVGPAARDFWPKVAPPSPEEATWAAVGEEIADRLRPVALTLAKPEKRSRAGWYAGLAASVAVAAGAWWHYAGERNEQVADVAPRSVEIAAAPREVAVPADAADLAAPETMAFAEPGDVIIEKMQPHTAMTMMTEPNDPPMIYVALPRSR